MSRLFQSLALLILAVVTLSSSVADPLSDIKIGLLKFGTVNWEMNVITHHGLAKAEGVNIEILPMASLQSNKIALQSGTVDMIVADWLWVARQRRAGADFTFIPYSRAIGAVVVPQNSNIKTLADLKGRRIGIAGGPLDKSWLMLRARIQQEHGFDLDENVDKVFGSPPLLNHQMLSGRIDALVTFWHYVARLEAQGYRPLTRLSDTVENLGVSSDMPIVGFTFSQKWAEANREKVQAFVNASRKAKDILGTSDAEWMRIMDNTKAEDLATLEALRDGYRAGIPEKWGTNEREGAHRMYDILAKYGGRKLVGSGLELAPGTFWSEIRY